MSLPVFLKSKTFLVFVFVGTLALGTFSVVGAYLLKKGAGRQERTKAQTQISCPAGGSSPSFTLTPNSSLAVWPNTISVHARLENCAAGQQYKLMYYIESDNPAGGHFYYYTESHPGNIYNHLITCGNNNVYEEDFSIPKENITKAQNSPNAPPITSSCSTPLCTYRFFAAILENNEWKDLDTRGCQANFQITPQAFCDRLSVIKGGAPVASISPGDTVDLKVWGNPGGWQLTKVTFFYKKNVAGSTPVKIGEGQKVGQEGNLEVWAFANWTVPNTFANGESYDFYAEPQAGSLKCNPYRDPNICGNCKTTVTVASQPTVTCGGFEVKKGQQVVNQIQANDQLTLIAKDVNATDQGPNAAFYYVKHPINQTSLRQRVVIPGNPTRVEHNLQLSWVVPNLDQGATYDIFATPSTWRQAGGVEYLCRPYPELEVQPATECPNCKATVTVPGPNPACTLTANPSSLGVGQTSTLTAAGSGGTAPYTFQNWAVAPSGGTLTPPAQPSGNQATWQAPASLAAETAYTASVGIKDSQQRTATCNTTITVSPSLVTRPRCQASLVFKNSQGAEITSAAAGEAIKIKATPTHSSGDGTKNRKAFFSYTRKLTGTTPNYCPSAAVVWQTIGPTTGVAVQCDAGTCTALADWTVPATLLAGDYVVIADIEDADGKKCLANPSGPCAIGSYACGDCQAVPGQTYLNCTGCQNTLAVTVVTTPPTCKGFTLNKTQAKDTEEVTANLTLNSGSSGFKEGQVFLHAATAEELRQNNQHYIGPLTFFNGKTGEQTTTFSFVPRTFNVGSGANIVWLTIENTNSQACTDRPVEYPVGRPNWPLCGCGAKTLTVTVCPTCQGIQMTPAGGTVSAGSPITFVATFKRGSEPSSTVSFKITKPGGAQETITCPKASPECTITSSGEQIVATLKYVPATAGQYLAKASASCGGGGQ